MALHQLVSLPTSAFTGLPPRNLFLNIKPSRSVFVPHHRVQIQCAATAETSDQTGIRRSGNYPPSMWVNDYIQSLTSKYKGKSSAERHEKLKEDVRMMLNDVVNPLNQLELIDNLQRLGLSYHFDNEIKENLNWIDKNNLSNYNQKQESLYAVALEFRILREHGYDITTEIFSSFRDEEGNFKSSLVDDCKGILSLYDAVFLLKEGEESIFHDARNFTTRCLKEYVKHNEDQYLSTLVNHALELPLHWRMPRVEIRWFIDVYEKKNDFNPVLLELAKLDFNVVQAIHQEDLKYASSWWRNLGLAKKLHFARDRMMEGYLWTVGMTYEPQFGLSRRTGTKVNVLITILDDVYDVYGTMDELELFTDAVDRWEVSATEQLPDYMKICFLALYNSINEMGYDILREQGIYVIPRLKKAWTDLCKAYFLEAKWYHSGYIPTLEEYVENALVSISAEVILLHAYFFTTDSITKEDIEGLAEYENIIRWSAIILRLADDMGTSSHEMERGDVPSSIQCYMHETGASEEDAREHVREMIATTWMKMNKDRLEKPHLSNTFVRIAMNLGRMAQFLYLHGDGHGINQDGDTKDHVLSLFVNPIP